MLLSKFWTDRHKKFLTFESKSQKLYEYIGNHILSILLVIGSYLRNHEAERFGLDEQCKPVDVRQLFNKSFFKELIMSVFHKYFNGFVCSNFNGDAPFDFDELAQRMIEEMGIDRSILTGPHLGGFNSRIIPAGTYKSS